MDFEFDPAKAASNLKKHGVSFADAEGEDRFVAVGEGSAGRLLVVVYVLRGEGIRLISAPRATPSEVRAYES
jgi:hypothetical protein